MNYANLAAHVGANARALAAAGASSRNVALLASNSIEYVVGYWSLHTAGAAVVPINPRSAEGELEFSAITARYLSRAASRFFSRSYIWPAAKVARWRW